MFMGTDILLRVALITAKTVNKSWKKVNLFPTFEAVTLLMKYEAVTWGRAFWGDRYCCNKNDIFICFL
jgi:hypothetical protein